MHDRTLNANQLKTRSNAAAQFNDEYTSFEIPVDRSERSILGEGGRKPPIRCNK